MDRVQQSPHASAVHQLNLPRGMSRESLALDIPAKLVPNMSPSPSNMYSDRFIPSRKASNFAAFSLPDKTSPSPNSAVAQSSFTTGEGREDAYAAYSALLRTELFPATPDKTEGCRRPVIGSPSGNVFRFKFQQCKSQSPYSLCPVGADGDLSETGAILRKTTRKIPRTPFKVLDAPALQDDFYLNLVDWSSHNLLVVGLGPCVYLWSTSSSKVTKLCDLGLVDNVCSVAWTQRGTYLVVGTNSGNVQIWDATHCKNVRTMEGHRTRVGTLAWNSHILSSGSTDKSILQRDIRDQNDFVSKFSGHKLEVCGLKWSYDDRELASGGNDNQRVLKYNEQTAAVKAIAWSPHQHGLLASGGGTADRCIRFWNTATNTSLNCVDTGSQVCNLVSSKNVNELVSTHGYSHNQIIVWRYSTMLKLATLTGHTMRVLYLAISHDG